MYPKNTSESTTQNTHKSNLKGHPKNYPPKITPNKTYKQEAASQLASGWDEENGDGAAAAVLSTFYVLQPRPRQVTLGPD